MACEIRWKGSDVKEELQQSGANYTLLQAIRILESHLAVEQREKPGTPLGQGGPPAHESVRFRQNSSAAFGPQEIAKFSWLEDPVTGRQQAEVATNGFNLLGQLGTLPQHYTSFANERRLLNRDETFEAFCNLFQHRAVSLWYRGILKSRVDLGTEQGRVWGKQGTADTISLILLSLMGLSTPGMLTQQSLSPDVFLYYSGNHSAAQGRVVSLEAELSDYFGIAVKIEQFCGYWINIPENSQTRLGTGRSAPRLGQHFVSGSRVWDQCNKIRIRLGPLTREEFQSFLPGSHRLCQLRDLVQISAGMECDYDIQLILQAEHVPDWQMNGPEGGEPMLRLGYNSWIKSRPLKSDAEDMVINSTTARQQRCAPSTI